MRGLFTNVPAAMLRLPHLPANSETTADDLAAGGSHLRHGDIALLRTRRDEKRSLHSREFWTDSPYLSLSACQWLLDGQSRPLEEYVSHDVLLRNGVILIEYACNLGALTGPRTTIYALPLRLPDANGAPARVTAVEPD